MSTQQMIVVPAFLSIGFMIYMIIAAFVGSTANELGAPYPRLIGLAFPVVVPIVAVVFFVAMPFIAVAAFMEVTKS